MNMIRWVPLLLILTACGGGEPTGPSPMPAPTPAPIVAPDPAQFDATFNQQLVHDAYDHPGASVRAALLTSSPSIYVQSAGLSAATVAAMEAEARAVVPMFSGGKLSVASFESGPDVRAVALGWIVAELINDPSDPTCGRANVGGHIWLNRAHPETCGRPIQHTFGHEIGHALGFYHVADPACLMSNLRPIAHSGLPCDKERYHAGLAYQTNGAYSAARVVVAD